MKYAKTGARVVLGALYLIFGLNFFFHFIPQPPSPEAMGKLMGAFFESGYMFQMIKTTEIVMGALLLLNLFTPLALIILAPITLNIVAAHAFLDMAGIGPALLILILHLFLGIVYLPHYRALFVAKARV